ncbi:MAG TPA: hypothetical protein PLG56_05335 [Lacunisphaera sp.]|jgi:hypothetical protein|nr:hypothetical protein [Lacunisphaera sp.]
MGIFGKKTVHITKAVPSFVASQQATLDSSWQDIDQTLRKIFPPLQKLNPNGRIRAELLAATLSIDSHAIDQIYDDETDLIVGFLCAVLDNMEPTGRLKSSFQFYHSSWKAANPAELRPWDAVASAFLEKNSFPFETVKIGDIVVMSPIQIAKMSQLLLQFTPAWWMPFSKNYKLQL